MNEDPPSPVVADAVAKSFGSHRALQDLSLRVEPREIVGFVGPNGAGKSTLLRILTGLVPADAGRVAVFGIDPGRDEIAVRRRVSYLPGETNVYSQMTGQEYLDFATGFHRGTLPVPAAVQEAFEVPLAAKVRTYSA
ncbi:MAG: ATP-binding cassette domain-containing protein, partial [Planctomycetes bacterium]|nr:ATP-binding cassette domain-containing protein [Planctomycetota bacterium]